MRDFTMKGLRDKKNALKRIIYGERDHLIAKMEDEEVDKDTAKELFGKLIENANEYFRVCNDLQVQWSVFKEIEKIARLNAENDQVRSAMAEVSTLVHAYGGTQFIDEEERTPNVSPIATGDAEKSMDKLTKLISNLEASLADAKQQQKELRSHFGVPTRFSTPNVHNSETHVLFKDDRAAESSSRSSHSHEASSHGLTLINSHSLGGSSHGPCSVKSRSHGTYVDAPRSAQSCSSDPWSPGFIIKVKKWMNLILH